MSRNGSGSYSLPAGNPVVTGTSISSTWANNTFNDVASALTQSISNDGQTPIVANLPMAGFRHTGVGNAAARTDYCSAGQAQDNTLDWLTSIAGTDTITGSAAIGLAAYAAGQVFRFVSAGANTTTTVTLNINALGAKAVTKNGAVALAVGDIPSGCIVEVVYDGTRFQLVGVAVNYASTAGSATSATSATSASISTTAAFGDSSTAIATTEFVRQNRTLNSRNAQGAAYSVVSGDRGKLIDATTGTWALTMNPATLGANFAFAVRNSGSGIITLTPTTGTINGAATDSLNPGGSGFVFCDGTNFEMVGKSDDSAYSLSANLAGTTRLLNTNYTNSSSRMIFIMVVLLINAGQSGVGYLNTFSVWSQFAQSSNTVAGFMLAVPPGVSYKATVTGSLNSWYELT